MGNLTGALAIILSINAVLFLGQAAVNAYSVEAGLPANSSLFYACGESTMSQFSDCGNLTLDQNPSRFLPGGTPGTEVSTGNIFTDVFTSIKEWILDTTGIGFVLSILAAPMNLLKAMNLPAEFAYAIGALWYGITLFVIIAFIWDREG